ncbi:hypothetical protein E0493_19915 [Roseomonas sp. M0104]|uniref:Restriction endonuclease n=1 Tax=Teichococcus coralli TaxID=2545983 RepID=A0A845BQD7_9PROT|nr:hypothetical protein [Pseudoroseomonas coralli]MXP65619.1 hypothetical protein [Pseudoroseomonas coralli]
MRFDDLGELAGRAVNLTARSWAMARLLGSARTVSNRNRAPDADRGDEGNDAADLHGALGELLLLSEALRRDGADVAMYMRQHMFSPEGGAGVFGPDLQVVEGGRLLGLDVKTFDCQPNKRYFAVNSRKHAKLKGCCEAYLGLVVPAFGRRGVLSGLIPYEQVSTWRHFSLRQGGSPSYNLIFTEFTHLYMRDAFDLGALRANCYSPAEVEAAMAEDGPDSARALLVELLPNVEPFLLGHTM